MTGSRVLDEGTSLVTEDEAVGWASRRGRGLPVDGPGRGVAVAWRLLQGIMVCSAPQPLYGAARPVRGSLVWSVQRACRSRWVVRKCKWAALRW